MKWKSINLPLKQGQRGLNVESLAQATRRSREILCQAVPLYTEYLCKINEYHSG